MKKLSKALSLILLLALIVSVFAVLPAFAADEAEASFVPGTVIRDWDTQTPGRMAGDTPGTMTKNTIESTGQVYWQLATNETYATPSANYYALYNESGAYNGWGDSVIIQDYGTKTKNTDFLVIDFDISTDTVLLDDLYFHMRWRTSSANNQGNNYPEFDGQNFTELSIGTTKGSYNATVPFDSTNKWRNVTIVYDFTTIQTMCAHVYIDGVFCGTIQGLHSTAACYLYFIRVCFPVQADTTAHTNFANGTITKFPAGYDGKIDDENVLCNPAVTLDQIPELAYTQEDCPDEKLATYAQVVRGDETFDLYNIYDIDEFDFVDGDKLVFLKSEANEVIIPSDVDITVVDADGNDIASSALVTVPTITPTDYAATQWIIRDRLGVLTHRGPAGTKVHTDSKGVNYTIDDDNGMFNVITTSGTHYITLLSDVKVLGGTEARNIGYGTVDVNLNGHTITLDPGYQHLFNVSQDLARIVFRNGNLRHVGGGKNLLFANSGPGTLIFKDLDSLYIAKGSTLIDQRVGYVIIDNCKNVVCNDSISSTKSLAGRKSFLYAIDSVFENNAAPTHLFYSGSITASSIQQGSYTNYINVIRCDIKHYGSSVFGVAALCSEKDEAAHLLNNNYCKITVEDSTILSDYRLVDVAIRDLDRDDAVAVETFTLGVDLDINDSIIGCSSLVGAWNETNISSDVVPYQLYVNAVVNGKSEIRNTNALMWNRGSYSISETAPDDHITLSLTMADGVKLGNSKLDRDEAVLPATVLTLGDGSSVIAGTSLGGKCNYVVTTDTQTVSYIPYGTETPVEGVWASGEGETPIAGILEPSLKTTATTAYRYKLVDGVYVAEAIPAFPLKTNLTLSESISINVFIPTSVGEFGVVGLTLDGVLYDGATNVVNLDGTDYYKVVIQGITPKNASVTHDIGVTVKDVNAKELTFTKTISVVDYLDKVYSDANSTEAVKSFIETIFTYIVKAAAYGENGVEITAPEGSALVAGTPAGKEYVAGEASGLDVALGLEDGYRWIVEGLTAGESVEVSYTLNGEAVTKTLTVDENGKIAFAIKACDLFEDVTVGDKTFTFESYAAAVYATSDEATKTLIDAIYDYAAAAAAYKAN